MSIIETLYGPVNNHFINKLSKIKLLVCDVDGIFSDGSIFMGNNGEELKAFHTLDGYGVKSMLEIGIDVAIVTGRQSAIVENRMSALGVSLIIQGVEDKKTAVHKLKTGLNLKKENIASMGDDMPDVGMFEQSSVSISVPNGHPYVKSVAEYVTKTTGGAGAVREICDLILFANNKLNRIYGSSV
ncbi:MULTISPECIES: 3-deoxy-manno-octulosonate-8-phosphatase KdsC [Alteromonadaceae]|uniref:3-deoxy-manno-octulosonate-8-phosphatase KdsC n=1 Tax=Alteromonadaceae TaxID=72275 RepID=UPI001C095E96|nr:MULTISPECIES: 3-deoxy-manno-octulosonate-8-phosphatase KdsC [unclassified Aliiglaciecola]MBU2879455.1 3-deoxy-manno-octulosonate-8-phosphatase KdsC [Aliiglaciecola lipolytica]MDO6712497.1 3-deoxy-manno-octulosonate-8-phosphatase KdsC [Aliiglaciecola sp. 2_MG-2023]MDO6753445.1 3-deoxy-manno-octulosonate-8-phosphatase KdsC [Aliiglaciecola sp. 1_MG-2023]